MWTQLLFRFPNRKPWSVLSAPFKVMFWTWWDYINSKWSPFPKGELAKSKLDCIQSLTPAILATHWDLISANSHAGFDASYYYPTQCITVLDYFHSTVLLVFYGLHQANQTRWITVQLMYSQEPSNHSRLARMIHHPADIEAHASPSLVWF